MSMLDKLFSNKLIKNAMTKQFNDIVKSENIKAIVIEIDDNGEMKEPVLYKENVKVLKVDDYTQLINALTQNL